MAVLPSTKSARARPAAARRLPSGPEPAREGLAPEDQGEGHGDHEVARRDHLRTQRAEHGGRSQRDHREVQDPAVVALAPQPEQGQRPGRRRAPRATGRAAAPASAEGRRRTRRARRAASRARKAGPRPTTRWRRSTTYSAPKARAGAACRRSSRNAASRALALAQDAGRRPGERSRPEEERDELREEPEDHARREEQRGGGAARAELALERGPAGEREERHGGVAARLRREVHQQVAGADEDRGHDGGPGGSRRPASQAASGTLAGPASSDEQPEGPVRARPGPRTSRACSGGGCSSRGAA